MEPESRTSEETGSAPGPTALPWRLPVEYRVGLAATAVWAVGVLLGLPVPVPSRESLRGLELHFAWPLLVAAVVQLVATAAVAVLGGRRGRAGDALVMVGLTPLVALSVYLYFSFKAWTPLVNPALHDAALQRTDEALAPLLAGAVAVRQAVAAAVPWEVDHWYGLLFFAMFFVSLAVHAVVDPPRRQRELVLGLCLNLVLGGLAYWLLPAEGPFLWRDGVNESVRGSQQVMHEVFWQVRQTGELVPGAFTAPLGAMPSLHVAHSLLFVVWAARSARWLLVAYVPVLAWILVEAPASGWHYLLDLPAGALLAVASLLLARRLLAARETPPGTGKRRPWTTSTSRAPRGPAASSAGSCGPVSTPSSSR